MLTCKSLVLSTHQFHNKSQKFMIMNRNNKAKEIQKTGEKENKKEVSRRN